MDPSSVLPTEILIEILANLDIDSISNLSRVSAGYSKLCRNPRIWELLFRRDYRHYVSLLDSLEAKSLYLFAKESILLNSPEFISVFSIIQQVTYQDNSQYMSGSIHLPYDSADPQFSSLPSLVYISWYVPFHRVNDSNIVLLIQDSDIAIHLLTSLEKIGIYPSLCYTDGSGHMYDVFINSSGRTSYSGTNTPWRCYPNGYTLEIYGYISDDLWKPMMD